MTKKNMKEILKGYWNLTDNHDRKVLFDMLLEEITLGNLKNIIEKMEDGDCDMLAFRTAKEENL